MTTEELKAQIGKACWANDPLTKTRGMRRGVITTVTYRADAIYTDGEIQERIVYTVKLIESCISKRTGQLYNRTFDVSGNNIQIDK